MIDGMGIWKTSPSAGGRSGRTFDWSGDENVLNIELPSCDFNIP